MPSREQADTHHPDVDDRNAQGTLDGDRNRFFRPIRRRLLNGDLLRVLQIRIRGNCTSQLRQQNCHGPPGEFFLHLWSA